MILLRRDNSVLDGVAYVSEQSQLFCNRVGLVWEFSPLQVHDIIDSALNLVLALKTSHPHQPRDLVHQVVDAGGVA